MVFFRRILNFNPQSADQRDKRHHSRYDLQPETPIRCTVSAGSHNLSCIINNLSSHGANLGVPTEAKVQRGDTIQVTLNLDDQSFRTAAKIVHVSPAKAASAIGLVFEFADFEARKAYLQLLEPISIGVSLNSQPVSGRHTEPGFETIRFHGIGKTLLTVWRDQQNKNLTGFEFRMNDYYVRNGNDPHELAIYVSTPESSSLDEGVELKRTDLETKEVRQLYRWAVAHLNPAVPPDIRDLMKAYT